MAARLLDIDTLTATKHATLVWLLSKTDSAVCKELGLLTWANRYKSEAAPIAGNPRRTTSQYNDYPKGFPYPDSLTKWR